MNHFIYTSHKYKTLLDSSLEDYKLLALIIIINVLSSAKR